MTTNQPLSIFRPTVLVVALTAPLTTLPVLAQTQPNAGQLLQQERPVPQLPKEFPPLNILNAPTVKPLLPGGVTVKVQSVRFSSHTIFTDSQLKAILGEFAGQTYDMAGLQALADRVTLFYRAEGYPFALAYLAEQEFADGVLNITLLEGRYGELKATGEGKLGEAAQAFLGKLKPNSVIGSSSLERAVLVLGDQPGIKVLPVIRPGETFGTGNLDVQVLRQKLLSGEVGVDNHGNRYTGENRVRVNLQADSPFSFGDQLTLKTLVSEENQMMGNVAYSRPLGSSGLRGNIGFAHSYYELGKQFSNLRATGSADIASIGLSYPLLRSQRTNLTLLATFQSKQLNDKQGSTDTSNHKRSDVLPVAVQFDHRDELGGGGITYGALTYTSGNLKIGNSQIAYDAATAKTNGQFEKWSLDVARVQSTPVSNLSIFARTSVQWAGKNLDSSEDFGLGGVNGVRGYPGGEGYGDEGWLAQLEARYAVGPYTPYVFHDIGHVKTNHSPWVAASQNSERDLASSGLGLRYLDGPFNVDASLAWRDAGGKSTSDTKDQNPRFWVTGGWMF
ncbi:MAG: hypothetical protein RIR18_2161 [Pseudomonadota bacterium]|jgi:hemolysin activation/secretion protein